MVVVLLIVLVIARLVALLLVMEDVMEDVNQVVNQIAQLVAGHRLMVIAQSVLIAKAIAGAVVKEHVVKIVMVVV